MTELRVVADENIADVKPCFSDVAELRLLPGRAIDAAAVAGADALLVRSVTQVNKQLLSGSRVRFVGSATSGIDHVDCDWLHEAGIAFAYAPGANANSVVDYVFSVLACLCQEDGVDWLKSKFGIVGAGNIGGLLARKLAALGIDFVIHDPFLDQSSPFSPWLDSLESTLACDIVSLHTPLTTDTAHPTRHMISASRLAAMDRTQVLINAARGAVVDTHALLNLLGRGKGPVAVLDAWEDEPGISMELLARVRLGTPHIAGYSEDGKVQGTAMIRQAFDKHFQYEGQAGQQEKPLHALPLALNAGSLTGQLSDCISAAYDVRQDHVRLQELPGLPDKERAAAFDTQRRDYPRRPEFSRFRIDVTEVEPELARCLATLGFAVTAQTR